MHKKSLFLLFAIGLILVLSSCDLLNPPVIGNELSENITAPRTLSAGTYTVTASFYVSSTLTIDPGVTIRFANGTWIDVSTGGRILANGTNGDHILFTSNNASPAAGAWAEIVVEENGSSFTYCDFRYATSALDLDAANITVNNCTFTSNTYGVDAEDVGTGFTLENNAFTSNNDPLWFNASNSLSGTNTFTGNTNQRVYYTADNIATGQNRTWAETDVPIFISAGFYIAGNLSISAGVTLSFTNGSWFEVSTGGTATATGTSGSHITFTSASPAPSAGIWSGLYFQDNGSSFTYCDFWYAAAALNGNGYTVTRTNVTYNTCTQGWVP
jgi:parallel beta-helix repeat protein